jgi:predicted PurR-regulated permease PerM
VNDTRLGSRLGGLLVVVAIVWLIEQIVPPLQHISDILLLFFLAWLVAFILEPLVSLQERLRVPRGLAIALVYVVLLLGLVLIGVLVAPPLVDQLGELSDSLPRLAAQVPTTEEVTQFFARLGLPARELSSVYRPDVWAQQLQSSAGSLVQKALSLATGAVNVVVNLLLLLVISYYLLRDGRQIIFTGLKLVPEDRRDDVMVILTQVSANFGGFLRGQVIQAALFGLTVALVMWALGMDFVVVAAISSAALMLIPLIGPIFSLVPPLLVALFQPQGPWLSALIILAVVQTAIVNVLMPRILSKQMGMPPLLVFAGILLGLRLGGPLGAFFGIPIMGAVYGTASELYSRWKKGDDAKQPGEPPAMTDQARTKHT